MVALNKLKGKFVEQGKTYADAAKALGCSRSSIAHKMNGRVAITCNDAILFSELLSLTPAEKIDIFLPSK